MSETHFRFRTSGRFRFLLGLVRFRPEIDGIRVHDDGNVSISLGSRILQTTAGNINGIELVERGVLPFVIGVRRLPGSRSVTFATDHGSAVQLSFREPVRPATGVMAHQTAKVTIENPTELLPAILAARRSAEEG